MTGLARAAWVLAAALALVPGALLAQARESAQPSSHAGGTALPLKISRGPVEIEADGGIEWQQKAKTFVARGNARARQGEVTVRADKMSAHYRDNAQGGTDVWRIDAEGSVRILAPGRKAEADKGVYDVERRVVVLTGRPRFEAGADRITARDSLEYWLDRNLAVARGNAIAIHGDRRLRADVLSATFASPSGGTTRLKRIDAFDKVLISTKDEIVRADRGVYTPATGIVRLEGGVKITRGKNQLDGERAEVNLETGVSRLFGGAGGARGLFMPGSERPAKGEPKR